MGLLSWLGSGKKKKKTPGDILDRFPDLVDGRAEPFVAYVERTEPKRVGNTIVAGKLRSGGFRDLYRVEDLEKVIQESYGGGSYKAELRNQSDASWIGTYLFGFSGESMVDGKVIEDPGNKKPKKEDPTEKLRAEVETVKVSTELDEAQAERQKKRRELGLEPGNEEDEMLKEKLAELERKREEDKKEFERRLEEERRDKERRTEFAQLIQAVKEGQSSGGNGQELMMQMIKMMSDSSNKLFERLEARANDTQRRSDEMFKAMQEKADKTTQMMIETMKESKNERTLDGAATNELIHNVWATAQRTFNSIQSGQPIDGQVAEEDPDNLPAVIHRAIQRVGDIVSIHLGSKKNAPTPEQINDQIRRLVSEQLSGTGHELPAPGQPQADSARQTELAERETQDNVSHTGMRIRQVRAKVDRVVDIAVKELKHGLEQQTWLDEAKRTFPEEIYNDLMASQENTTEFIAKLRNYASPRKVNDLVNAFVAFQAAQQRAAKAQAAAPPKQPRAPSDQEGRRARRRKRDEQKEQAEGETEGEPGAAGAGEQEGGK